MSTIVRPAPPAPATSERSAVSLDSDRIASPDARAMLGVLAAATAISSVAEEVLREAGSGLRATEWDVLAALHAFGPMRPAEITRRAWMSANAPTVHAILGRLEARGMITREAHPERTRAILVSLTATGKDTVEHLFPVLDRKVIGRFAAHFSDAELDAIVELMERV